MTADELQALYEQATPTPWHWDSYSRLIARVSKGDHMDDSDPEDAEPSYAIVLNICQAPRFRGHGDELHDPETRANAKLVEALVNNAASIYRKLKAAEKMAEALRRSHITSDELAAALLEWEVVTNG